MTFIQKNTPYNFFLFFTFCVRCFKYFLNHFYFISVIFNDTFYAGSPYANKKEASYMSKIAWISLRSL